MHHILFRTHMRPFATTLATLALAVAGTMPSAAISRQRPAKSATTVKAYQRGLQSISMEAAKAHVFFLADNLLEGRRAGQAQRVCSGGSYLHRGRQPLLLG